jgi:1-acyl-sn-glycerol-3-phosphate acyltransferase
MQKFDAIRPYYDSEVNNAICSAVKHPMMKSLMNFAFPDAEDSLWIEQLKKTHSIRDFQGNFIYKAVQEVLKKSSDGLTTSGFEKLEPNTSYLFISNHRDIILDTSLLNVCLFEHGLTMTASAIGDNLIQKPFLETLSKLNRNFVVQRGLSPRELLQSSKLVSEYISQMLLRENRSVWIAQREGRTKDGNDITQQGVLKMIAMASEQIPLLDYFKKLKVVPVSISYEYDPTDALKMPQLMATANNEVYVKEKNEDFKTLLSGIMGQKRRIHIDVGNVISDEIEAIKLKEGNNQKQIQSFAQSLDKAIVSGYRLWPTNYVAYDLLHQTNTFSNRYSLEEKTLFERRLEMKIDVSNTQVYESFLAMYANPVVNKLKNEAIQIG